MNFITRRSKQINLLITICFLFINFVCYSKLNNNWFSFKPPNALKIDELKNNHKRISVRLKDGHILIGNRKLLNELNKNNEIIKTNIVYEFLGVPFAQPPLNEKRFQFPHRLNKLLPDDVYDATYARDSCMQEFDTTFPGFSGSEMWNPPGNVSEDCLHMNIWVPVSQEQDDLFRKESEKQNINEIKYINNGFSFSYTDNKNNVMAEKATLFWIYGGSYYSGSASLQVYDGTIMAAFENVIILGANYRLGPFGFLYLNNSDAPGNAGMADHVLAIEWYREKYLKFFGGSTTNFCLFGESAGSISSHFLLLSEKHNLFNRIIFQSLSAYLEDSYRSSKDSLIVSLHFAEKVGCLPPSSPPSDTTTSAYEKHSSNKHHHSSKFDLRHYFNKTIKTSINALKIKEHRHHKSNNYTHYSNKLNEKVVQCLLKLNASYLSQKQFEIEYVNEYLKMQFVPTLDYHNLFDKDPFEYSFAANKHLNHDILAGVNQNEGTFFLFYLFNNVYYNLTTFLQKDLTYDNKFVVKRLNEALKTKFPTKSHLSDELDNYYYDKYVNCLANLYTINGKIVSVDNFEDIYHYDSENNDLVTDFNLDTSSNRRKNSPELAWKKMSKIIGDVTFACPTIKIANKYSELNPKNTYFYRFNKKTKSNPWPKWFGGSHGFEIEYVFGIPWLNHDKYEDEDRVLSRKIISYWANFAKTGKLYSHFDDRNREFYADFSPSTFDYHLNIKANRSNHPEPNEEDEYDLFNNIFLICDLINQYSNKQDYATKYEICKKYTEAHFNKSNSNYKLINYFIFQIIFLLFLPFIFYFTFNIIS